LATETVTVNHLAASYSCLFVRKISEFILGKSSDHFERRCYMNPNQRTDVPYCKINHGDNSDYPYNDVTENKGEFECIFLIGNMSFNIRFQKGTF
jgi:hypothetical protein